MTNGRKTVVDRTVEPATGGREREAALSGSELEEVVLELSAGRTNVKVISEAKSRGRGRRFFIGGTTTRL